MEEREKGRRIKELPLSGRYTSSCLMKPLPRQMKQGFFVQSMKVMGEQNRCNSLPRDLFSKSTVTAKKLLQHYFAARISGRARNGQEVLFGTALGRLPCWSVGCHKLALRRR